MTFTENWNNLIERSNSLKASTTNTVADAIKEQYPLSDSFRNWVNVNWLSVKVKLNAPELGVVPRPLSEQDWANYHLTVRKPKHVEGVCTGVWELVGNKLQKEECEKKFSYREENATPAEIERMRKLFPVSEELERHVAFNSHNIGNITRWVDERIREWNRFATPVNAEPPEDFGSGDDHGAEYSQAPEIIDSTPHLVGLDEYGDEVYRDFDDAGHFVPMGNPHNSTDYQDDFDPHELAAQQWESVDGVEDHHIDHYHFEKTGITENPVFKEVREFNQWECKWETRESIDWETENPAEVESDVYAEDDVDFVEDARNWLERERLTRETECATAKANIRRAYPVSPVFTRYLEENEVDYEATSQRLQEYMGIRKEDTESKLEKAIRQYDLGESIEDIAASLNLSRREVQQSISKLSF